MRTERSRSICGWLAVLSLLILAPLASAAAVPLSDFAGTYDDGPGHVIELVAAQSLIAVVDGALYPLKSDGPDAFLNSTGDKIPFRRGADGKVSGYSQDGVFHRRLSAKVQAESLAMATARPRGAMKGADYRYAPPRARSDGLAVGDIARTVLGVDTAQQIVGGVLDGAYPSVHSVLLYQDGKLVLEEYFYGYGVDKQQQLRSATKSFVSAAVGIATDKGLIPGAATPVTRNLAYADYRNPDPRKAQITLGDMMTMRSGLACNDYDAASPGREEAIYPTPDWVKTVMDLPQVNDPGKAGFYCSGGVAVAGRVVENASKTRLPAFVRANLFRPLGIADKDWSWNYDLTQADREFSQLHMRPRDMLKFGILYADGGRWQGKQIVPADWIKASLSVQSQVDGAGYGYFWWRPYINVQTPAGVQRVEYAAAQGNGGQKIYIFAQFGLVAVFTGGDYNSGGSPPNKIMSAIVLPRLLAAQAGRQP